MSSEYDYNFVSTVNRAYSRYPERLSKIIDESLKTGTLFQKSYICALIDYMRNRDDNKYSYYENYTLPELVAPDMITEKYSSESPIPEFMKHNIYVTKVGWP